MDQVRRLALLGMTDEEISAFFEIDPSTLYRWDEAHPEFRESRACARDVADGKVAEKLYHRALGYSHPSEKIFMTKDGEIVRADIVEHYPPDTQAITWWLKNRQGKRWKDKAEVEHSGSVNLTSTLDDLANKVFSGQ